MVKNKKGQMTSSMSMMLIGLVVVAGLFFLIGSGSKGDLTNVVNGASDLEPNTDVNNDKTDYPDRDKEKLIEHTDINDYINTNSGKGIFTNITYTDKGIVMSSNGNVSINMSNAELKDYFGDLGDEYIIETIWINTNYDVNGFDKYFQAILLKNTAWNTYELVYTIETNNFVINDLKKVSYDDFELSSSNYYKNPYFINNTFYINVEDITSIFKYDYVSVISVNPSNELFMTKSINQNTLLPANMYPRTRKWGVIGLTNNQFEISYTYQCCQGTYNIADVQMLLSINEELKYSKDTIATMDNTRTTGFDEITFVKQEITTGVSSFGDKYFKILNSEDLQTGLTSNAVYLNDLALNIIDTNLDLKDINNPISLTGTSTNSENFEIVTEEGDSVFDYNEITALVLDNGYISNINTNTTTFLETDVIRFEPSNSLGVRFSDLGSSSLSAETIEGITLGNIGGTNVSFAMNGEVYLADLSIWERIIGSIINWNTYDFAGLYTYATGTYNNPQISNDNIGDCAGSECKYGFQSAFKNSGTDSLDFTTEKPLTSLLKYNNKHYWLFWSLSTRSENNGCIIFDKNVGDLGVRIPVSMCDNNIGGTNSIAEFALYSEE